MSGSLKNLSRDSIAHLGVLSEVGRRINTPESFSDALQAVLDTVVATLDAERGAVFVVDSTTQEPVLSISVDRSAEDEREFSYSQTVVDGVWKERKSLMVVDAQQNEEFACVSSIQVQGIRSVVCVPIIGRDSALGLIYLDNRISDAFVGPDIEMIEIIANLAATALERAKFFDALQSLNERLEQTVSRRTAEAEQARQVAEEATRAKSLFLANMSHELRTPLNGVLGLTEDLLQGPLEPHLSLRLEQISSSARSLASLVNSVLDFSKAEAGRLVLEERRFELEHMLKSALATVVYAAEQKGLNLEVSVSPEVPTELKGDSLRLKQILVNLLGNAVKFTLEGKVGLRVTRSSEGIRFCVWDTGVGIAESTLPRIFSPFSQADASTTRQFGGTGLGLSICKTLSDLFGGTIEVSSQIEKGSSFVFTADLEEVAPFRPPALAGKKIWVQPDLLVTDNEVVLQLETWGGTITEHRDEASLHILCDSHLRMEGQPTLALLTNQQLQQGWSEGGFLKTVFLLRPALRSGLAESVTRLLGQPSKVAAPPVANPKIPSPPEGTTMLVAEDHEINQLVVQKMAESWGYDVHFVNNGRDVLGKYLALQPRVLLLDIEMPELDGFEAARLVRSQEIESGFTPVPIIAVTAHLAPDLRSRCLASGIDDLLGKPLSREEVAESLWKWEEHRSERLARREIRYEHYSELAGWPQIFISEINGLLRTLEASLASDCRRAPTERLRRLENLSFSAGLLTWGSKLAHFQTNPGDDPNALRKMIEQFQQEWIDLAPTLVSS